MKIKKVRKVKTTSLMLSPWTLHVNQSYNRIWEIAKSYNTKIQPRKGFVFLEPQERMQKTALWCIHLNVNPLWENNLNSQETVIVEKRRKTETPLEFQKRLNKGNAYNADVVRIVFAKSSHSGKYRFVGLFKLSLIDFDLQTVTFRRVEHDKIQIRISQTIQTEIIIEEDN